MIKQMIIPVAAFIVTATGVSAFTGGDLLKNLDLGLTDDQVSALEEAHDIRQAADEDARQVLEDAGLDETKMREVHDAMREARDEQHIAIDAALEADDYEAFVVATADSPLADAITSEADFEKFKEAHDLRDAGDTDAAEALMSELGLERPAGRMMDGHRGGRERGVVDPTDS